MVRTLRFSYRSRAALHLLAAAFPHSTPRMTISSRSILALKWSDYVRCGGLVYSGQYRVLFNFRSTSSRTNEHVAGCRCGVGGCLATPYDMGLVAIHQRHKM